MTEWSRCRCLRGEHATNRGFIRCKYPPAKWITGTGDWALVAWCGRAATFTLWATETEARDRDSLLFASGCGTYCRGKHELIYINRKATS
ncbi:hypothetical protein [Agrococcus sp. ProA11]|uniref:hypothetical protein n=1 Tax=Agrococcus chionoecetis TaxID=3153752 RepID=UPI0032612659